MSELSEQELWERAHPVTRPNDPLRAIPNWLRWLLVLPASLLSYAAVCLVMGAAVQEVRGSWIPGLDRYGIPLYVTAYSCFLAPWASVMAGSYTAPVFRSQTALALACLWCMAVGVLEFSHLLLTPQRIGRGCMDGEFWFNAVGLFFCAVSAGVAAWGIHHEEKPPTP